MSIWACPGARESLARGQSIKARGYSNSAPRRLPKGNTVFIPHCPNLSISMALEAAWALGGQFLLRLSPRVAARR